MRRAGPILFLSLALAARAHSGALSGSEFQGAMLNPAAAAFTRGLELTLVDLEFRAGNDSYSVSDYERWNGSFWTDAEKREIVSGVAGSALDAYGQARLQLGAAGPGWAAGLRASAAGDASLPRDLLQLALFGNQPGRIYDLAGARGDASAIGELRLAHGAVVPWSHPRRKLAVGATLRLLHGWATAEVQEARGALSTTPDVLTAEASLVSRTSTGGDGLGIDLGAMLQWDSGLHVGFSLENAPAILWWDRDTKRQENRAVADSLTLNQGEDSDLFHSDTETQRIAPFSRSLPLVLHATAGRPWRDARLELGIDQGCGRAAAISRTPRVALGAGWPAHASRIRACAGVAVGGLEGTLLSGGAGFSAGRVQFDLSLQSLGGLLRGRGIGAALALRISPGT